MSNATVTESRPVLSERTAAARAAAALTELDLALSEIKRLRRALLEADVRVERALTESRRLAREADRAMRGEAAAVAQAARLAAEWDAMAVRRGEDTSAPGLSST